MKKKYNIRSLEELEKEQEKLKMVTELTKQEFASSIGTNRKHLQEFLLKKVIVPVGATGLGIAAIKKLTDDDDTTHHENGQQVTGSTNLLGKLLPYTLDILQMFLINKQHNQIKEIEQK